MPYILDQIGIAQCSFCPVVVTIASSTSYRVIKEAKFGEYITLSLSVVKEVAGCGSVYQVVGRTLPATMKH